MVKHRASGAVIVIVVLMVSAVLLPAAVAWFFPHVERSKGFVLPTQTPSASAVTDLAGSTLAFATPAEATLQSPTHRPTQVSPSPTSTPRPRPLPTSGYFPVTTAAGVATRSAGQPTPSPTAAPTNSMTATANAPITASQPPIGSQASPPSATATATSMPTATRTPGPTRTQTPTEPVATATQTVTGRPTAPPTASRTATLIPASPTATRTATDTESPPIATASETPSPTATPEPTSTPTSTSTPTEETLPSSTPLLTVSISGRVHSPGDQLVSGATIHNTPAGTTTTGDDGTYSLAGLLPGDYLIEPEMANCRFSPQSRVVVLVESLGGNDFSAFCDDATGSSGTWEAASLVSPGLWPGFDNSPLHAWADGSASYGLIDVPGPWEIWPGI